VFVTFNSIAGVIIPIPINSYHHGGHMTNKDGIALWIVLNVPIFLIFIIRSIIWLLKNKDSEVKKWSYVEYVIFSNGEFCVTDLNFISFVLINGVGILVVLGMWISSLL
jgi:hypothetical protein